jgi:potassium/hydrogen antiporter
MELPGANRYIQASWRLVISSGHLQQGSWSIKVGTMESAAIKTATHLLLIIGVILGAGLLSGILAKRLRMPDVVLYLLAGIALGPELAGLIDVKADSAFNQIILIFGSCYLLFDGGASLRLSVLKKVWITIVVISTLGVVISVVITGWAAAWLLGLPTLTALLLGAVIASTDPATLVPVFKQVRIRERVAQTVMSESAFNDAMGAIITFSLLGVILGTGGDFSLGKAAFDLVSDALIGLLVGGVLGYAAAFLIAHEKFSFLVEYAPLVTLMAVVGAYMSRRGLRRVASWRFSFSASSWATRMPSAFAWKTRKRRSWRISSSPPPSS